MNLTDLLDLYLAFLPKAIAIEAILSVAMVLAYRIRIGSISLITDWDSMVEIERRAVLRATEAGYLYARIDRSTSTVLGWKDGEFVPVERLDLVWETM